MKISLFVQNVEINYKTLRSVWFHQTLFILQYRQRRTLMDQIKIGNFISSLRKEKQMTQKELADTLHVSDRAISKWENGRGLPELSLLQPLCKALDISINELLNGERMKKDEKVEETLLSTIAYSDHKIKKSRKGFLIILFIVVMLFTSLFVLFGIDVTRMNNNEPIFFSTWGFDYASPVDLKDEYIQIAIEDYLVDQNDASSKHYDNEKWFASIEVFLIDEIKEKSEYIVYAWALEESFYRKDNTIVDSSGSSIPYKFTLQRENDVYQVIDAKIPRDGSYYVEDLKALFPSMVRNKIKDVHKDGTIKKLMLKNKEKAKLYFKL